MLRIANTWCDFFTAIGTVGAVVVSLWLANKSANAEKPKLRVNAYSCIITGNKGEVIGCYCTNERKHPIILNNFALAFNKNKPLRIGFYNSMPDSDKLPKQLVYSDSATQQFLFENLQCQTAIEFMKQHLSNYKWLAKLQLKHRWKICANTALGEFYGNLADSLINKIISIRFNENYPEEQLTKNKQNFSV